MDDGKYIYLKNYHNSKKVTVNQFWIIFAKFQLLNMRNFFQCINIIKNNICTSISKIETSDE